MCAAPASSGHRLQAALFDIDGTLVSQTSLQRARGAVERSEAAKADTDIYHREVFREILQPFGIDATDDFFCKHISGRANALIAKDLLPQLSEAEATKLFAHKEALFRERCAAGLKPLAGLIELLTALRAAGVQLAAVTNAPKPNVQLLVTEMDVLGVKEFFSVVVLGEECSEAKPSPVPYRVAMERLGLDPAQSAARCVVFEDSPPGVRAGFASGAITIGVRTAQTDSALRAAGAHFTIADFRHIDVHAIKSLEGFVTPLDAQLQPAAAAAAAVAQPACRIVLDASLTPANAKPIAYTTAGGVPQGKLEFNSFVGGHPLHGFVLAVHTAYSEHLPLLLTPDDLWTVIVQGIGQHVGRNAEQLRSKFVAHAGKKLIEVRRDGFVQGKTTRDDWMGVVAELTQGVQALDNGESNVMKTMVQRFSTTQPLHTFGYQAALLSTMQNYASYRVNTLCGIPSIEFGGVAEDWSQLVAAVALLDLPGLDGTLSRWHQRLVTTLSTLASAVAHGAQATPDEIYFLKSIYKFKNGSGGAHVSGWLAHLFPYLGRKGTSDVNQLTHHLSQDVPYVSTDAFPPGLTDVPFCWNYHGSLHDMTIFAGFDDPGRREDGTVQCVHGFAVQYKQ